VVRSSLWLAAAFVVAVAVAPLASATPGAVLTARPATISAIERDLAHALVGAKTTLLVRLQRRRTPGAPGYQVDWIDLANGEQRALDYDALGKLVDEQVMLVRFSARSGGWNPSGACGCDLDPFTNFSGETLGVSLLGDQTIDGKATLHLRFTVTGGAEPSTTQLWIDRFSYLPVRSKVVYGGNVVNGERTTKMSTTDQFTWLARTSANLAHLGVSDLRPAAG
jgi:hypothetical protein